MRISRFYCVAMFGLVATAILIAVVGTRATAQETAAPLGTVVIDVEERRGPLPSYYSDVVTERQRESIYAIQKTHAVKIDDLKAQLAAAIAERDAQIDKILTVEQRQLVKRLSEEAEALRDLKARVRAAAELQLESGAPAATQPGPASFPAPVEPPKSTVPDPKPDPEDAPEE